MHALSIRVAQKYEQEAALDQPQIKELQEILQVPEIEYIEYEAKDFLKGIQRGYKETQADLLITVPGRHALWEDYMKESQTRKVAEQIPIPLLAIPDKV